MAGYAKLANSADLLPIQDFAQILLDQSENMIFIKDEQYRIVYANTAFLEMYPPEMRQALIGTTTIERFSEEEAAVFLREDQKAFDHGSAQLIEELTDYKGQKKIFQTRKTRFIDKKGRVLMLGVCQDITKWAIKEKSMAQANIALESFAAMAAHDLRSPLGAFISGIELIRLDKENVLTSSSMKFLEMMKKSSEGLIAQIGSLLSSYKNEDSMTLNSDDVDAGVLIEEIKFNLSHLIEKNDARIRSTVLPVIRADKNLFRQLLHNLIENSIKYRSADKPIIIIRYELNGDNQHLFSVEDNGLGVRAENRRDIFAMYKQQDGAMDGYGIGLSLCKKIIENHGGSIWVDPLYKDGCKIFFTIPA